LEEVKENKIPTQSTLKRPQDFSPELGKKRGGRAIEISI
jgi:hypothetical protein